MINSEKLLVDCSKILIISMSWVLSHIEAAGLSLPLRLLRGSAFWGILWLELCGHRMYRHSTLPSHVHVDHFCYTNALFSLALET